MATILEKLKNEFGNLTRDQIKELWESGNFWDHCGPKIDEFLTHISIDLDSDPPNLDYANLEISDNLGSNFYSNLFFKFIFNGNSIFSIEGLPIYPSRT